MLAAVLSPSRRAELVSDTHPNPPRAHSWGGIKGGQRGTRCSRPAHAVQDTGELCLQSAQCKSGCCHRVSGLSLARCAPKAAEFQECSPKVRAPLLPGTGMGMGTGARPPRCTVPCFPAEHLWGVLQVSL